MTWLRLKVQFLNWMLTFLLDAGPLIIFLPIIFVLTEKKNTSSNQDWRFWTAVVTRAVRTLWAGTSLCPFPSASFCLWLSRVKRKGQLYRLFSLLQTAAASHNLHTCLFVVLLVFIIRVWGSVIPGLSLLLRLRRPPVAIFHGAFLPFVLPLAHLRSVLWCPLSLRLCRVPANEGSWR